MKKQVTLSSINRAEVLRYLGYKGIGADETINSLIDECEAEVLKAGSSKICIQGSGCDTGR